MPGSSGKESVLVLGGGIAGLQAAIDLAENGLHVYIVERSPSIGGRMAQLDKTFPTNDCSLCILAPKMMDCASHPAITLMTYSELESITGRPGRFRAVVRRKSRFVDEDKCTGCGDCVSVCPVEVPNEFEMELSNRKAIYKPFAQAVPNKFTITKPGIAPCKDVCPAHLDVQAYVQLVKLGKYDEALGVIHKTMPFAGTIGRICPRPCEDICPRGEVDEPISIAALKRAAADFGKHLPQVEVDEKTRGKRAGKPVAVVGAGPAGLAAAYRLALRGYPVTVFEKLRVAGGMLRVGVPEYRLPREVLDGEIDIVRSLGVVIKTSSGIRGAGALRSLFRDGFKAVFLATGAHGSIKLGVCGESLKGVLPAVDLLRRISLGKKVAIGRRAVVVGGGNAAVDAARTLVRLGCREVTILYRRSREEMPALPWEVEAALAEGVRLELLAAPVRVAGKSGRVFGVEALRMRLGEPDSSGRRRPVPVEGFEFRIPCDMVVPAIGQKPVLDFVGPGSRLKIAHGGTVDFDEGTCSTNLRGVFVGGDAATGPASAIEAIAAGNRAARAIERFLEGDHLEEGELPLPCVRPDGERLEGIMEAERANMPELSIRARRRSFREVDSGLSRGAASAEAERCLNCAVCSECRECERVCEAGAVNHDLQDELVPLRVGAIVVATGFNMMDPALLTEYGGGKIANVVTGLEFERMLSASGPTGGRVRRLSDGGVPKTIAFIQCAGSRDVRNHAYCSAVCCMHATKEAILAHEHDPDVTSTIFYVDLRAAGKNFQDYVERARTEYAVRYVRSRPGRLEEDERTGNVRVIYEDTMSREMRKADFEMVVLCQALIPAGTGEVARLFGFELDEHGFIRIPDPLARPVDTTVPGVYAVGFATGPGDIPDSVVQASAAAGRIAEELKGEGVHG